MAFQQYPQKLGIPSGDTGARPGSPVIGDTYYNGTLEMLEIYNGTDWVAASAPPASPTITTPVDAQPTNDYVTGGALSTVFTPGSGGGTPTQYTAFTTVGGFSGFSTGTTVVITGLIPGVPYEVYGAAQNNFGLSVNSGTSIAVTPTSKPQLASSVTATTNPSTTTITVSWVLNNTGGKNLTAQTITAFDGVTAVSTTSVSTTATSGTVTGLTSGTAYTFKITKTNANGDGVSDASNSVTVPTPITIEYVVMSGGAGGGGGEGGSGGDGGGGGGAGGYATASTTLAQGSSVSIVVGSGGGGGPSGTQFSFGSTGTTSSITVTSPTTTVISSIIGGGGGGGNDGAGQNGACGGGAAGDTGTVGAGSVGFNGGAGGSNRSGGGGGGNSSAGGAQGPGNGGAGVTEPILSLAIGGGGAGASGNFTSTYGTASSGGGSNANASANTGGGGSGQRSAGGAGFNGGSGVVIIKTAIAATSVTGGPTVTSGGGFTNYRFNSSGTINW